MDVGVMPAGVGLWGSYKQPYEMPKRVSRGIVIRTSNLSFVLPTGCEQTRQN